MDELDVIREIGDREASDAAGAKARALATLTAAMDAADRPAFASSARRRRRRWPLAIAAALVLSLALSLVLVPLTRAPNAAAATLESLAAIAATRPRVSLAPGHSVYTKSQTRSLRTVNDVSSGRSWAVLATVTREIWIASDGSGRIVESTGRPEFPSEADRRAWEASGQPPLTPEGTAPSEVYGPGELTFLDLSSLPPDEGSLRTMIEKRQILSGPAGTAETFDILGDLLRETYASPQLRAALYRVAAALPGIELLGRVTDAAGRPGLGVAYSEDGVRQVLIIDARTSAMLGERTERENSGAGSEWSVYLKSGVVSAKSQIPN